jgi:heme/copper-type cytochrome/quinol oxidase subunit 3
MTLDRSQDNLSKQAPPQYPQSPCSAPPLQPGWINHASIGALTLALVLYLHHLIEGDLLTQLIEQTDGSDVVLFGLLIGGAIRGSGGGQTVIRRQLAVGLWPHLLSGAAALAAAAFTIIVVHYWKSAPALSPASAMQAPVLAAVGLTGAWALLVWSCTLNEQRLRLPCLLTLIGALLMATGGIRALLNDSWTVSMMLTEQTTPAVIWLLTAWTAVHAMLGMLMIAYCTARCLFGRLESAHDAHMHNSLLYWTFLLFTAWITIAILMLYIAIG